jgi:DNA-binding response OmpR family regulator
MMQAMVSSTFKKILIIEDESDIAKLLAYNLEKEGYRVYCADDGAAGFKLFQKEKPHLVLLDVMLPKMDGLEVCRLIRGESAVPIIMLTAKREEVDRILGLELGADDYVTKPFSVREVLVRIKGILRRSAASKVSEKNTFIKLGELEVDTERYEVRVKNKAVLLSSKEFEFLKCLLTADGRALSREKLLELVWGYDAGADIDTRTVDQHIARLRDKLGPESHRVVTVKNIGYRFKTT